MPPLLGWFREFFLVMLSLLPEFMEKSHSSGKKGKIIFLHGLFANNLAYGTLRRSLTKAGYEVHMPDLGRHAERIPHSTKRLHRYVEKNVQGKFFLIGASIGGIIALEYLVRHPQRVKKIVTLGTPFYGAGKARLVWFSPAAAQIRIKSPFLRNLRQAVKKKQLKRVYSIATPWDEFVPLESTRLKGAHHITKRIVGHVALANSPSVFREIRRILRR